MNGDIIIIGGYRKIEATCYATTFHVMQEPKGLQQLAMKIIYKHRDVLRWQCLPQKLTALLGISKTERNGTNIPSFGCPQRL